MNEDDSHLNASFKLTEQPTVLYSAAYPSSVVRNPIMRRRTSRGAVAYASLPFPMASSRQSPTPTEVDQPGDAEDSESEARPGRRRPRRDLEGVKDGDYRPRGKGGKGTVAAGPISTRLRRKQ